MSILQDATEPEADQMMQAYINQLLAHQDLAPEEAEKAMTLLMQGLVSPVKTAAFLIALRSKGERPAEIAGCARAMRALANRVQSSHSVLVDTCGTGGDGTGSFNISTTAAFVVAGAGVPVAKHGNRSVSSRSGSADVLEALGVQVDPGPDVVARCLEELGIAFFFAPRFHPSMRHAAPVRKALGVRTIFNILGPLTNPAGARHQVLGVYSPELTFVLAEVLLALGSQHALVVHGHGGYDEFSITGPTQVTEIGPGGLRTYYVHPEDLGLQRGRPEDMAGGSAEENAAIARAVLSGQRGPRRDVVLLNAAAGLLAAGAVRDLAEGVKMAADSIDSGRALRSLEGLGEMTRAALAS